MNFYELEIWQPKPGAEAAHDDALRAWFAYVKEYHAKLFPEWTAAHYFQEVLHNQDQATGRFGMLFGYDSYAGFRAYKERRKDYAGPYQDYLKIDPFIYFDMDTKTQEFWQSRELDLWLDW